MGTVAAAAGLASTVELRRKKTQAWADGPNAGPEEAKAYTERLADYLTWVAALEPATPTRDAFRQTCLTLRRISYSRFTGGAGPKFDMLFDTENLPEPVTTRTVPRDTLDRLYQTGAVMPGSPLAPYPGLAASPVDNSHLFVGIDFAFNRKDFNKWRLLAHLVDEQTAELFDTGLMGVFTWVGDLASWFVEWNDARARQAATGTPWTPAEAEAQRKEVLARKMSLEDLLGDVDAQVLAQQAVADTSITSVATLLTAYYLDPAVEGRPHVTRRFADFVRVTRPGIPHTDTGGTVALAPTAATEIASAVSSVAWLFLANERRGRGIRTAVESAAADVAAGAATITAIAGDFVAFLTAALAGGQPDWPSDHLGPLRRRYGGFYLQPGDDDATKRYGGTVRPAAAGGHVAKLQADLRSAGFTAVPAAGDPGAGTYEGTTQWAVRHLQGYAGIEGAAGLLRTPTVGRYADPLFHLHQPRRYRGPRHGCLDPETATTLDRYLSETKARGTGPDGKVARVTVADQLRCPVVMETWKFATSTGAPTTVDEDDIWLKDDATTSRRVWARDATTYYDVPGDRVVQPVDGIMVGQYASEMEGGPLTRAGKGLASGVWDPEAHVTPLHVVGRALDPAAAADAAAASTWRALSAIAHLECVDQLDCMNGYDNAIVSLGLVHWTIRPVHTPGELFALLAYFRYRHPELYERFLGVFGVYPAQTWPASGANPMWDPVCRVYNSAPALWGLTDGHGPVRDRLLPVPVTVAADADYNRFRDWHWWYRFLMMARTCPELWHCQWTFGRLRLRDLLAAEWATSVGATTPFVPNGTGGHRPATFGEVFTSEHAVALLCRYHVNDPSPLMSHGRAGYRLKKTLTEANLSTMDTTAWTPAQHAAILTALRANPPAGFSDVGTAWDHWHDETFGDPAGRLSDTPGSFRLDDTDLPDLQPY